MEDSPAKMQEELEKRRRMEEFQKEVFSGFQNVVRVLNTIHTEVVNIREIMERKG